MPFWAVWPFEILVCSRRHLGSFPDFTEAEVVLLAQLLQQVTSTYDKVFDVPFPYSMGFHQSPTDGGPHHEWHFHAHFYPPLLRSATIRKFMVGFEMLGMPQFVFVLGIGFALKRYMKTSTDFFLSGRSIPAWIAGLAFISANLGAQEVIGMGASGAKYGIATSHFYWIGAIPAMVFVGLFMMPFYYGSRARSVPEYLKLRFDEKTRGFNAISFAVMTVFSSGHLDVRAGEAARDCARLGLHTERSSCRPVIVPGLTSSSAA